MNANHTLPLLTALAIAGCAPELPGAALDEASPPRITGLSTLHAAVGEEVRLTGTDFVDPGFGWVDVTFAGTFVTDDGESWPVELTLPLEAQAPALDHVVWSRFGGYRIPFGPGDRIGTFRGTVFATNRYYDGSFVAQDEQTRLAVRFEVDPSVVVLEHRAFGDDWHADCAEPSTTTLGGFAYRTRIRTVGFEAQQVEFTAGPGLLLPPEEDGGEPVSVADPLRFTLDGAPGEREYAFVGTYSPVPDYRAGYASYIDVFVTDTDGGTHQLLYPFVVNSPFTLVMNDEWVRAEVLPAEPVSGCTPGGHANLELSYSEQRSETRSRTTSTSVSRGWTRTVGSKHTETYGASRSMGGSETEGRTVTTAVASSRGGSVVDTRGGSYTVGVGVSRTHSETDDESFSWNLGAGGTDTEGRNASGTTTVGGETELSAGVPGIGSGNVSVSAETARSGGHNWGSTNNRCPEPSNAAEARVAATIEDRLGDSEFDADGTDDPRVSGGTLMPGGDGRWRDRRGERQNGCLTFAGGTRHTETDSDTTSVNRSSSSSWSRATGRTWNLTRTYTEANSFSTSRNWSSAETFAEARETSESIGESLSMTEGISETVSTTEATSLSTRGTCFAGLYCTWFRQTTRWVRYGAVVAYDLCGNADTIGTVVTEDWTWSPDLAVGESCATQVANFDPPYACFEPPCQFVSE